MTFKFDLKQAVTIAASGESGEVTARCESVTNENSYCVRYKSADGRAVENWWGESALTAPA